jgi:hypothetical protein
MILSAQSLGQEAAGGCRLHFNRSAGRCRFPRAAPLNAKKFCI